MSALASFGAAFIADEIVAKIEDYLNGDNQQNVDDELHKVEAESTKLEVMSERAIAKLGVTVATNVPKSKMEDLVIANLCQDIDERALAAAQFINDVVIESNVSSESVLQLKWKEIMTRAVDPVDAYKATKSLSLYYQTGLGYALLLLKWQQHRDPNGVRAKIATKSQRIIQTYINEWDNKLEKNGDAILPYRISNWGKAFLPDNRKNAPLWVAWDAYREPYPAENLLYGVRLTQPPPQSYFDTGLQVWENITNDNFANTDMTFRIFRDNETSTYTIGVADGAQKSPRPPNPGDNRLGVCRQLWSSNIMPTPIYNTYPNLGLPKEAVQLKFQIDPATVKSSSSSDFAMIIEGAPGTEAAGIPLKFGDNDYFRFANDKHGKYKFRIFQNESGLQNIGIKVI